MLDMRKYKNNVKNATARERELDKNWSWRVISVSKGAAKIGWGYLDYIGESDPFKVEFAEGFDGLIGTLPNEEKVYCLVGSECWNDSKTFEEAVETVIHRMAARAHNTY